MLQVMQNLIELTLELSGMIYLIWIWLFIC
jgi:hypothetical protein